MSDLDYMALIETIATLKHERDDARQDAAMQRALAAESGRILQSVLTERDTARALLADTQASLREHMAGWKQAEHERDAARAVAESLTPTEAGSWKEAWEEMQGVASATAVRLAACQALLWRVQEYAAVLPQEIVCDIEMILKE